MIFREWWKEFNKTQDWLDLTDNLTQLLNQTNLSVEDRQKILNLFLTYARLNPSALEIHVP